MKVTIPTLLLFWSPLVLAAPANEDALMQAVEAGLRSGDMQGALADHIHPELMAATNALWGAREAYQDALSVEFELRPMATGELAEIQQFFDVPVVPTHVLLASYTPPDSEVLRRQPLYLSSAQAGRYEVVFGLLKGQDQIAANQSEVALAYTNTVDGLWLHTWDLRFGAAGNQRYAVVVRNVDSGWQKVLVDTRNAVADGTAPQIRFMLHDSVSDDFYISADSGMPLQLPFAWQIENIAQSEAAVLAADSLESLQVIEQPAWNGDRLTLATFEAVRAGQQAVMELAVRR